MPRKTLFLAIGIIILIIILVIISVWRSNINKSTEQIPAPSVTATPSFVSSPVSNRGTFQIEEVSSRSERLGVTAPFVINFSEPVKEEDLVIDMRPSNPVINIALDESKKVLTITPVGTWRFDTEYTVKILSNSLSVNGNKLDKDYVYRFKTLPYSGI